MKMKANNMEQKTSCQGQVVHGQILQLLTMMELEKNIF